jgi:hypothetical protein
MKGSIRKVRKNLSLKLAVLLLVLYVGGAVVHICFKQYHILDMIIGILALLTLVTGFTYSIIAFKRDRTKRNIAALTVNSTIFLLILLDIILSHIF